MLSRRGLTRRPQPAQTHSTGLLAFLIRANPAEARGKKVSVDLGEALVDVVMAFPAAVAGFDLGESRGDFVARSQALDEPWAAVAGVRGEGSEASVRHPPGGLLVAEPR